MTFKDHFSGHAADYARYRPRYPREMFEYLAALAPAREVAWDCATGNGQAAIGLAAHFKRVIATDASTQQIEKAQPNERVAYRVASAEASGLDFATVDLINVAQALHWFDTARFFDEARRVLKPQGILAVSAYNLVAITPAIDALVLHFYEETTGSFWPPERALLEANYRAIAFPFPEREVPKFELCADWTLDQLLGYLRTWSATKRFMSEKGYDPVDSLDEEIRQYWQDPEQSREVRWPLLLRVFQNVP